VKALILAESGKYRVAKFLSDMTRRSLRYLILLTLCCLGNASDASDAAPDECSCLWQGSFSDVAATRDLTVLGTVIQVKGNAVDIRVESTLLGETWQETMRVWMKTAHYCRPNADNFPIDSRWVMALDQITVVPDNGFNPSTPNISYGRQYDYTLSSCGGYFLQVTGDAVIGNLVPAMPRWEYAPKMTAVLIDLISAYLAGQIGADVLTEASRADPKARELMLDTRSFLRGQDQWLEQEDGGD